jgi:multimeric flavodoxin WrbA
MKALIVYGSPHGKMSATFRLGSSFAKGLKDEGWTIDELFIDDVEIKQCLGCYACWRQTPGVCVQKDGMEDVIRRHKDIDLLVLASPLYFYSVPGKVKAYWDRCMPLFFSAYQKFAGQAVKSWTESFRFFLISTCGFPQKENFDGLLASAKKIYGPAYASEMLVPMGTVISQDVDGSKYTEFYDFFHKAGKEYGKNRSISEETKKAFDLMTGIEKMQELIKSKQ